MKEDFQSARTRLHNTRTDCIHQPIGKRYTGKHPDCTHSHKPLPHASAASRAELPNPALAHPHRHPTTPQARCHTHKHGYPAHLQQEAGHSRMPGHRGPWPQRTRRERESTALPRSIQQAPQLGGKGGLRQRSAKAEVRTTFTEPLPCHHTAATSTPVPVDYSYLPVCSSSLSVGC